MSQNKPTENEHFIPQVYLRGFSPDHKRVYQYDLLNWKAYPLISTRKICYQKNLYELENGDGDYICQNGIENLLSIYEGVYGELLAGIADKAQFDRNYNTQSFLTSKEKMLLIGFMSLQIIRMPYFIDTGKDIAIDLNKRIQPYQARNFSILTSLPIYKQIDDEEKNLFSYVAEWFTDMSFTILRSNSHDIFTSDNPIYIYSKNKNSKEVNVKPEKVIFPLTSNLVLYMLPIQKIKSEFKNRLYPLLPERICEIRKSIASASMRWLYSYHPLTDTEIKEIRIARSDRS